MRPPDDGSEVLPTVNYVPAELAAVVPLMLSFSPTGSTAAAITTVDVALDSAVDTAIDTAADSAGAVEVRLSAADGLPGFELAVDLADAVGYWHPGMRTPQALQPEWLAPAVTSLVSSAPLGVVYDAAGACLFGWAVAEPVTELTVRAGVSEERKAFLLEVHPSGLRPDQTLDLRLEGHGRSWTSVAEELSSWLSRRCEGEVLASPVMARRPVYSTWYTFTQDVDAASVIAEATDAAAIGCESVFIDDGWQELAHGRGYQGCGDWRPDAAKFPDLRASVADINRAGADVALWVAPLLLGEQSEAFADLSAFAPHWSPTLRCFVLDPRHARVREHLAALCLRLVVDYGIAGLKIDFLDQAAVYARRADPDEPDQPDQPGDEPVWSDAGTGVAGQAPVPVSHDSDGHGAEHGAGWVDDVGIAMQQLLADVRSALSGAGHAEVVFEFRQPYVSPAIARYGQVLRASDCPADSVANRVSTLDCRLVAAGRTVHADPMMWGPAGGAEAVAQQLYAGWFSVPQISMKLSELPSPQLEALRGLLRLWSDHAPVTLDGALELQGPEFGYLLARADRNDLGRAVIARYAPVTVDVDASNGGNVTDVTILNACAVSTVTILSRRTVHVTTVRGPDGAVLSHSDSDTSAAGNTTGATGALSVLVPAFGSVTVKLATAQTSLPGADSTISSDEDDVLTEPAKKKGLAAPIQVQVGGVL